MTNIYIFCIFLFRLESERSICFITWSQTVQSLVTPSYDTFPTWNQILIVYWLTVGGSWYSKDNEFETELVELLYAQSYRLLLQKAESARADPIAIVIFLFKLDLLDITISHFI
jgi:hypothetical protein